MIDVQVPARYPEVTTPTKAHDFDVGSTCVRVMVLSGTAATIQLRMVRPRGNRAKTIGSQLAAVTLDAHALVELRIAVDLAIEKLRGQS